MHCSTRTKALPLFLLVVGICLVKIAVAQVGNARAGDLLMRAQTSISGQKTISDLVLSGTVRRTEGATDETGQVQFQALSSGESSAELIFPSGPTREVHTRGQHSPIGEWSGPDRKPHSIAYHNLLVDSAWFSPALVLQKMTAALTGTVMTVGTETKGNPLVHLQIMRRFPTAKGTPEMPKEVVAVMEAASRIDFYLDPNTFLPVEMDFNAHPDNNVRQDIPVQIRYTDYRAVDGVQIPFHFQKFMNNSLLLDVQLSVASVNSGLTANSFVVSETTLRSLPQ